MRPPSRVRSCRRERPDGCVHCSGPAHAGNLADHAWPQRVSSGSSVVAAERDRHRRAFAVGVDGLAKIDNRGRVAAERALGGLPRSGLEPPFAARAMPSLQRRKAAPTISRNSAFFVPNIRNTCACVMPASCAIASIDAP